MVNSPSRPNVRPVAPPPLGGSVRHSLLLPPPGTSPARGGDGPVPTILDAGPVAVHPDDSCQIQPNKSKSRSLRTAAVLSPSSRISRLPLPVLERLWGVGASSQFIISRASNPQSALKTYGIPFKNRKIKIYQESTTQPVWNPATSNRHPARGSSICAFGLASRVGGFA